MMIERVRLVCENNNILSKIDHMKQKKMPGVRISYVILERGGAKS
jgi:hypothetical protein